VHEMVHVPRTVVARRLERDAVRDVKIADLRERTLGRSWG